MLKMMLHFAVYALVMLVGATSFIYAQEPTVANKDSDLASRQLENVQLEGQGVEALLTDLSLSYNIPIGLEMAPPDDEFTTYALDLKKGTLTDLLNQFVRQHNQYTWEIKDGTVNIFPKSNFRDSILDELLKVQISKFSVKENTGCWALVDSLTDTVEVQKVLKAHGISRSGLNFSGAYFPQLGRHFKLDVSDMTVKTILNKVIKESPIARIWLIKRHSHDQTFAIWLNASHEDFSTNQESPGL
ncbi:MAG TPA: hypothetical protein VF435_03880, partial [Pyrinomonadaceae bacterium]